MVGEVRVFLAVWFKKKTTAQLRGVRLRPGWKAVGRLVDIMGTVKCQLEHQKQTAGPDLWTM